MIRPNGSRARLGGVLLAVALGAAALLALPGIGVTKGHGPKAAGKIEAFDRETGELTVDLFKGGSITGLVVRRTHIRCGKVRRHRLRRAQLRRRRLSRASAREDAVADQRPDRSNRPTHRPTDDFGDQPPGRDGTEPGASEDPGEGAERRRRHRCIHYLVEGAIVKRADMVLAHGKAFYRTIGVVKPVDSTDEEPPADEEQSG